MKTATPHRIAAFLVALATPSVLAQTTWVVDDNGPGDFAEVSDAIAAAADGDTIFVRAGFYSGFEIVGKGLTVNFEGSIGISPVGLAPPFVRVADLGVGQSVALRNVAMTLGTGDLDAALVRIENCAAPVLLQDVSVTGFYGGHALDVENCAAVTLVDCDMRASVTELISAGTEPAAWQDFAGVRARDSSLFLYGTRAVGGDGGQAQLSGGQLLGASSGGAGVELFGSTLFASDSVIEGGSSFDNTPFACAPGGNGSPGLLLRPSAGQAPAATLLDCQVNAGSAGLGSCGQPDGMQQPDVDAAAGQLTLLPGTACSTSVDGIVQGGQAAGFELRGTPGDAALIAWSAELGVPLPLGTAVLHTVPPLGIAALGAVPPSGVLSLSFAMPLLPAGLRSRSIVVQGFEVSGATLLEGGPTLLTVLGSLP